MTYCDLIWQLSELEQVLFEKGHIYHIYFQAETVIAGMGSELQTSTFFKPRNYGSPPLTDGRNLQRQMTTSVRNSDYITLSIGFVLRDKN